MSMSEEEFEFLLGKTGAVETAIKKDPRQQVEDVMFNSLGSGRRAKNGNRDSDSDDDNDW